MSQIIMIGGTKKLTDWKLSDCEPTENIDELKDLKLAPGKYKITTMFLQYLGEENCMKEWVDNYRMVEYCVKQQSQAKSWLLSNSVTVSPEILLRCKSEWKTDYRMVKYCVESQSKSKRNLNSQDINPN